MRSKPSFIQQCEKTMFEINLGFMHQSISSANTPLPPGNPRGFAPIFSPGPGDLYHLNCPGVARGSRPIIKVPSYQLMPHEGTFQLQTDLPYIYCCSLVTKSVSKLGENFKTLSMVLKMKLEAMTKE